MGRHLSGAVFSLSWTARDVYCRIMATSSAAVPEPGTRNDTVDAIIEGAAAFAQPILRYLRELIHEAVPDLAEEVKWSRPFFVVNGTNVCYIAAFRRHCALGFWSAEMTAMLQGEGIDGASGSGSVGKIARMEDLPPRSDLLRYVREAAARARAGDATSPMKARPRVSAKAPIPVPLEFADALSKSKSAGAECERFSPSCRREYLEWITSAKRPETREKRIGRAVSMLEAGKRFNEEYR